MPPPSRAKSTAAAKATAKAAAKNVAPQEFYEWDALVTEAHVDSPPYAVRVPVGPGEESEDGYKMLVVPCPSGAAYVNLVSAQARGDVAGIIINLTQSGETNEANNELFAELMRLMGKADFPIVDLLATQVARHYFNRPPVDKDGDLPGE